MSSALFGGIVFGLLAGSLIIFGFPKLKREDSEQRTYLLIAAYLASYILVLIILSVALQSPGFTAGFTLAGAATTLLYIRIFLRFSIKHRKPYCSSSLPLNEDHPSWQSWYSQWHKKL